MVGLSQVMTYSCNKSAIWQGIFSPFSTISTIQKYTSAHCQRQSQSIFYVVRGPVQAIVPEALYIQSSHLKIVPPSLGGLASINRDICYNASQGTFHYHYSSQTLETLCWHPLNWNQLSAPRDCWTDRLPIMGKPLFPNSVLSCPRFSHYLLLVGTLTRVTKLQLCCTGKRWCL